MSHTLCRQYVHLIYGTKDFRPYISMDSIDSLFAYTTAVIKDFGGWLVDRSGTSDHIHLLINLRTDCSVADMVRQIKACSSKWYRQQKGIDSSFGWNDGYAAFTVSYESIDNVKQYFRNENTRHPKKSYLEELAGFLKYHEIEFKPEYLGKTTYTKLVNHLVWSVKNRDSMLGSISKPLLHERIRQEVEACKSKLLAIENVVDHIHLLVETSPSISVASFALTLKTVSSKFISTELNNQIGKFNWQEGYGVFSLGKPALAVVKNYVLNQEEHHRKQPFDDEWKMLLG